MDYFLAIHWGLPGNEKLNQSNITADGVLHFHFRHMPNVGRYIQNSLGSSCSGRYNGLSKYLLLGQRHEMRKRHD